MIDFFIFLFFSLITSLSVRILFYCYIINNKQFYILEDIKYLKLKYKLIGSELYNINGFLETIIKDQKNINKDIYNLSENRKILFNMLDGLNQSVDKMNEWLKNDNRN